MLKIDGYPIDAEIRGEPTRENEVTPYPVEEGADYTDHVRAMPLTFSVEGIVSDSPLGSIKNSRKEFTLVEGEAYARPSDEAKARLVSLHKTREPITVESATGTYKNMVLTSLSMPKDAGTGKALRFTATFKELVFVVNERTSIRVSLPRAAKKVDRGHKAAVETILTAFGFIPEPGAYNRPPPPNKIVSNIKVLDGHRVANRRSSLLAGN